MASKAPRRQLFVRNWLPVLAYVVLIFVVSAQPNLRPPLRFQNSDKVMHMLEYSVLGVLLSRALRTVPALGGPLLAAVTAVAIGAGVGGTDEVFQSTVPGRESSVRDFTADVIGLSIGQLVYFWVKRP